MIVIDKQLLDSLTEQAKASPRLRMNFDLRNTPNDNSQRMLNAVEPGTSMPIHRHRASSETVIVIRGKVRWLFYDNNGEVIDSVVVSASGDVRGLSVPKYQWHSLISLESGSVILSSKDGKYETLGDDELFTRLKN